MKDYSKIKFSFDASLLSQKYGKYAYVKEVVLRSGVPIEFNIDPSDISVPFSTLNGVIHNLEPLKWEDGIVRSFTLSKRASSLNYYALIGFHKKQAA